MNKLQRYLGKHSSILLSCVGAAGVIVTAILAIRATPKAVELLEEAKENKEETAELTVIEKVKAVGPVYIPTVAAGVTTIGCILGSSVLNYKQQISLMSAYTVIDSSYKKYKEKLKELYGKETDVKIQDELSKDRFLEHPIGEIADGKLLWYEPYRDEFFEMTEKEVIDAEYHTNRNFILRGETNLNEFYEFLGLDYTDSGCDIAWSTQADDFSYETPWIDFEHHLVQMDDGTEYYRIEVVLCSSEGLIEG